MARNRDMALSNKERQKRYRQRLKAKSAETDNLLLKEALKCLYIKGAEAAFDMTISGYELTAREYGFFGDLAKLSAAFHGNGNRVGKAPSLDTDVDWFAVAENLGATMGIEIAEKLWTDLNIRRLNAGKAIPPEGYHKGGSAEAIRRERDGVTGWRYG